MRTGRLTFWIVLAIVVFLSRLAHLNILWADEDYHLALAQQLLHGKALYRDVWYDKPPLNALILTMIGGLPGWPLRIFGTLLELAGAAVAYRFARELWGEREAYLAAATFAFFHVFFFPATALPLEPDSLMILPHLLAGYFAWRKRALLAGAMAGLCFLLNTKGLFVAAACVILYPSGILPIAAGFAIPCAAVFGWLGVQGAFADYGNQVWRWGFLYAGDPKNVPFTEPLIRLGSWIAFHSALWIGAVYAWPRIPSRELRWKLTGWLAISFIAAAIGWRLPPRYISQMLPALVILGSLGLATILTKRNVLTAAVAIALVIPVIRFGPRYAQLIAEDARGIEHDWRDATMDRESRAAAAIVNQHAKPGDTLFIWGYRPNVAVYTKLPVAGQMWESQPVTMVPADRHLAANDVLDAQWAREHQAQLVRTQPTFIVDGLSAYNPQLDIRTFPTLADWFASYCKIGEAKPGMTIYHLKGDSLSCHP